MRLESLDSPIYCSRQCPCNIKITDCAGVISVICVRKQIKCDNFNSKIKSSRNKFGETEKKKLIGEQQRKAAVKRNEKRSGCDFVGRLRNKNNPGFVAQSRNPGLF